ncbi:MAG: gephyrin-like molybdotransferase Glp [Bacillota bacterium]|jgi:molybdopterin molybdotransferase
MTELFQVVSVEEARLRIELAGAVDAWKTERLPLAQTLGRRVSKVIRAEEDVPSFDRSTVDGLAVKASDTFGASEGLPAYLEVVGEILMGQPATQELKSGQAIRIATGGMLPPGADAVVMIEYTEPLAGQTMGITRPVGPGENIIRAGEDVARGELIFPRGYRLRPQDLGFLASLGIAEVEVLCPWRVGIISTGDEVVEITSQPGPGQVRDVNSYTLLGLVYQAGGLPQLYGIVPDDFSSLRATVEKALQEQDLVILSGGSSVGSRDVTAEVINSLGSPGILFHGLALRPGKPAIGAVVQNKPVIGLPGHPASAMLVFQILVEPWLTGSRVHDKVDELAEESSNGLFYQSQCRPFILARLTRNLASAAGREDYVRVRLFRDGDQWLAEPLLGKSGLLMTMVKAHGLVKIPLEKQGLLAGETVEVHLFS